MKKAEFIVLFALLFIIITSFSPSFGKAALNEKVTRLHILANSDSDADQALKIAVRDKLINSTDIITGGYKKEYIDDKLLDKIQNIALSVVRSKGYDYDVKVSFVNTYFDTRDYGYFALPSGDYNAIRVEIGDANGKNWWCVLFPPLCTPLAEGDVEEIAAEAGLTEDDIGIITKDDTVYALRFKTIEIISDIKHFIFD